MRPTVSDLLRTHGAALIGREEELARARAILGAGDGPVALHVHGPGGVGKSAYLHEVERIARDVDRPTRWLDATGVASPQALLATLGATETAGLAEALHPATVVIVDHLEALALAERWFWRDFAPALPADCTLVVGSRRPPQHLDPRLEPLVEVLPLRNLPTEAAMHLLQAHGIPESVDVTHLVADTYGHPLALVIAADAWSTLEKGPAVADSATLLHHPDPAARLLGRFIDDVDDPVRRDALHVAAHARRLDRAILRYALGVDSVAADELLAWLRERPYAEAHHDGLGLHDVVRDALDGDLRWRDPDGYEAMHVAIRTILTRRLREGEGPVRDRAAHDLLYLHRGNPATQELYDYRAMGTGTARPAVAADRAVVVDILTRVEGPVRAARVGRLIDDDPGAVNVLEDGAGGLLGVLVSARVDDPLQRATDPLASAAWDLISARRPPEPGECVLQYAVADADHPHHVPVITDLVAAHSLLTWARPDLGWVLLPSRPAFFEGPSGVPRLLPLAQRLATDFDTDARFDNARAVQVRLPGFDEAALVAVGTKVRDLYAGGSNHADRIRGSVDDAYVEDLATAVTGNLGGKVGIAPRVFLKKLVGEVLDRVDQFPDFDPRRDYALALRSEELSDVERQAAGGGSRRSSPRAVSADDVELDL